METRDTLFAVDVENLYISLQRKHGRVLDLGAAIALAGGWKRILEVRVYADFSELPLPLLRELEFHPITRNNVRVIRGARRDKNAVDFELAVDLVDLVHTRPDVRKIVLGSGDGHYLPALTRVRRESRDIEIIAVQDSLNWDLERFVGPTKCHYLEGGALLTRVAAAPTWGRRTTVEPLIRGS